MGAPWFSVVIPTHDHAEFIGGAISCVLGQTWDDYEVVVVDNGSTDDTEDVVRGFDDPRITYHWQEDSGLPANSRNVGVGLSKGEYVAFLDSDDSWYPEKLERTAAVLDRTGADVVSHGVAMMTADGRVGSIRHRLRGGDTFLQLLYRGNLLTTSATTARRETLLEAGGFDERRDFLTVEDYDLWLRLARGGARFVLMTEELGSYLVHPGNASADLERTYRNQLTVLDEHCLPLAREGRLDVLRALWRRTRARLAMTRDLMRGGFPIGALRRVVSLPFELAAAGARYRSAAREVSRPDAGK